MNVYRPSSIQAGNSKYAVSFQHGRLPLLVLTDMIGFGPHFPVSYCHETADQVVLLDV